MDETQENQPVPEKRSTARRDFVKVAGALAGAAAMAQFISTATLASRTKPSGTGESTAGPQWGMSIDINKCIGCKYCTYACQAVNNLADNMIYNIVTTETMQNGKEYFLSKPCMHCTEAPCVHVCPVKATYHRPDGIVVMDYTRCIGCRYCQVACPYDARVFNWGDPIETSPKSPNFGFQEVPNRPRGVVEKCSFCSHRIDGGLARGMVPGVDAMATPACVVACPTGARAFGDLTDPESPVSKVLAESKAVLRLREEELSTEPSVYYVPPDAHTNNPFQKG
ncbi:MAG: 4Fe-4S dicluster domain-containing protein [Chloroflexi bacterium]|nr:4Fe-4S dicluster domain-containing protein [Chloroflexota bacterium]